jgi:hypothetical protein
MAEGFEGAILTPCIGVCRLDASGWCLGCHRSGEEIAAWSNWSDAQRLHFMDVVLPQRARDREQA